MNALRNLGDEMKTKIASGVVILASDMEKYKGKPDRDGNG